MSESILISCTEAVQHINDPDWRFIDCRFDLVRPDLGRELYQHDHLPGAVYAHLDEDLSSPIGAHTGRHPLPDIDKLVNRLCDWGIGDHTQVVVYDANIGMFASRLWWLLRWLGHPAVVVLDGGYQAWQAQGLPLSSEVPGYVRAHFTPQAQPGWVVRSEEVIGQQQAGAVLLDARAAERFRGEVEPIDPVAGHIPGALNYPLTQNMNDEGRFKEASTLRQQIQAVIGATTAAQVIHYCGSGVSACHNILAMELAGMHGSKLYAGSWSEWIRDPHRGVET